MQGCHLPRKNRRHRSLSTQEVGSSLHQPMQCAVRPSMPALLLSASFVATVKTERSIWKGSSFQLQLNCKQLCKLFRPAPGHHSRPPARCLACRRRLAACCRCRRWLAIGRRAVVAAACAVCAERAATSCLVAKHDPQGAGQAIRVGFSCVHSVAAAAAGPRCCTAVTAPLCHCRGCAMGSTVRCCCTSGCCCIACRVPVLAGVQQQGGGAIVPFAIALQERKSRAHQCAGAVQLDANRTEQVLASSAIAISQPWWCRC